MTLPNLHHWLTYFRRIILHHSRQWDSCPSFISLSSTTSDLFEKYVILSKKFLETTNFGSLVYQGLKWSKESFQFIFKLATLMFDICHLPRLRLLQMNRHTKEQRMLLLKHITNLAKRSLVSIYHLMSSPFENKQTPSFPRPMRSAENIVVISGSIDENPGTSTRHRLQWFVIKDLHLHPYKVQLTREL